MAQDFAGQALAVEREMGNQVETSPRQLWSVPVRIELDITFYGTTSNLEDS